MMLGRLPARTPRDRGSSTVLIADDEPGIRNLLRITLNLDGIRLIEAANGVEAIALARAAHPDVVLLDVKMPLLDGFEVCRRLRADPDTATSYIIILTRLDQPDSRSTMLEIGADAYLSKPFSPLTLLQQICDILEERRRESRT
jgi:DNA-binding response OmpR family regulator